MRFEIKRYLFIITLLIIAVNSFAQFEYTTQSKKAIKSFEKGQECYNNKNTNCAEEYLLNAIEKDPDFIEAHILLADTYVDWKKYNKAIEELKKVIALDPKFFPNAFYFLGQLEMKQGLYENAKKYYLQYLSFKSISSEMRRKANRSVKNCAFAIEAIKHPVPFKPKNLGANINTELPEYYPCITVDNGMLLFTRQLEAKNSPVGYNEDFYVSYKFNGQWSKSINMGQPINTAYNEGAPTLSSDGQFLIFTACEIFGDYGVNRKGAGSCDLFVTKKVGERWIPPVNIGQPVNSFHWETQPSFSSDGKTLYFIRGLRTREGIKKQDIWKAVLNARGQWSQPERLSNVINTPEREESVFIHPDGQTLYFSSNGHPGMGGLDIFMSTKDETGKWSKPINLGYPINTYNDENSLLVSADGKLAYFASDREGGYGQLDLYSFELPDNLKPQPITYMKGKVFDKETKQPLESKFELIDLSTEKVIVESYSNKGNGEFLICVPVNRNYALNVSRKGYLFYSENFSLKDKTANGLYSYQPTGKDFSSKVTFLGQAFNKLLDGISEGLEIQIFNDDGKIFYTTLTDKNGKFQFKDLHPDMNYIIKINTEDATDIRLVFLNKEGKFTKLSPKGNNIEPYQMDVPLQPIKAGNKVVLKNVFFDTDKYFLKDESKAELKKLVVFLKSNPTVKIEISGYTDNIGTKESNQILSENRSKAVYDYLVKNGIVAERLTYKGYGDNKPIATNDTEEGRALNRRTEFKIIDH